MHASSEQVIRARARRSVQGTLGFRWHARVYLLVSVLLGVVNWMTTPGYLWSLFPIVGWAVGVLFHWFAVRDYDQREQLIENEVQRRLAEQIRQGP